MDEGLREYVDARPVLRVPGAFDAFEVAVRAVLGQQVSVAAARTLASRIVMRWGEEVENPCEALTHLFPSPAVLSGAPLELIGLPTKRAEALRLLAGAFAKRELDLDLE